MTDSCQDEELMPTAVPNSSFGTRFGRRAEADGALNALATPKATMTANTGQGLAAPETVNHSSARPQPSSVAKQAISSARRLSRSAAWPAGRTSSRNGRNWLRPMMPRSSGRCVSS